jgi:hypothetical protein
LPAVGPQAHKGCPFGEDPRSANVLVIRNRDLEAPARSGAAAPWKRDVGAANERFHEIFVQLLQQVWVGIENVNNSSGSNPTDASYIGQLSQILRDMFDMRRRNGQLAREEFVHVSTMAWFHLTVDSNTPLVRDLGGDRHRSGIPPG